jgi:gliding motility-associated-like protein
VVNDAPSFTRGSDPAVCGNSGLKTVINWATNINKGAADESAQALQFAVTNNNNALFAEQPAINTAGTLSFTLAVNQTGTALVSVQLKDNGGILNGGVDTSPIQTFTITIHVLPVAPAAAAIQTFCGQATLNDLTATAPSGSTLLWYAQGLGGVPLTGSPALTTATTYYAESVSTANGCSSSSRTPVLAMINGIPPAPLGNSSQTFCSNIAPKISDIVVAGQNIKWYSTASGGAEIPGNTLLVHGKTYYASQTYIPCESSARLAVTVSVVTCTVPPDHYPTVSDFSVTTIQNQSLYFVKEDFTSNFSDPKNDILVKIMIESLPVRGVMELAGTEIQPGQEILAADIGKLEYIPDKDYSGETSFRWNASDGKAYSLSSASAYITVTQSEIFIPEGFSPNGDGINDYFVIAGAEQYTITLRVFNRWGNKVFEAGNYKNDWNGISNIGVLINDELPGGTYFYTVSFNNDQKERVGYLTLNR